MAATSHAPFVYFIEIYFTRQKSKILLRKLNKRSDCTEFSLTQLYTYSRKKSSTEVKKKVFVDILTFPFHACNLNDQRR